MSDENDNAPADVAPAPAADVSPDAAEVAGPVEDEAVAEPAFPIHPGLRAAARGPVGGVATDEDIPLGAGVSPDWLSHVSR